VSILEPQKSRQNGLSDNVLFWYSARVSQYDVNEGADNKHSDMDSVPVDIENVVIMWWALQHIATAYLKPGQHDLFLNVLGNQTSHFDQLWPASPSL